jgi:uncharacterized protein
LDYRFCLQAQDGQTINKKDYAGAYKELLPLAQKGDSKAQTILGIMYALGQGVPKNQPEEVKWFTNAAEQKNVEAEFKLGIMYFTGQGTPQNYKEAKKWFEKAAYQRHPRAQYNLGVIYCKGLGLPKDYFQAYMWWSLAAKGGHPDAKKNLDVISKGMTQAQIVQARKLAMAWKPKVL